MKPVKRLSTISQILETKDSLNTVGTNEELKISILDFIAKTTPYLLTVAQSKLFKSLLTDLEYDAQGNVNADQQVVVDIADLLGNPNSWNVATILQNAILTSGVQNRFPVTFVKENAEVETEKTEENAGARTTGKILSWGLILAIMDEDYDNVATATNVWSIISKEETLGDVEATMDLMVKNKILRKNGYTYRVIEGKQVILEGLAQIKRRHTEKYPAKFINPEAKLRNKILSFFGDSPDGRRTLADYNEFCNQLQEDVEVGKRPSRSWLYKNSHLIRRVVANSNIYYRLTDIGKRALDFIRTKTNESVDFGPCEVNIKDIEANIAAIIRKSAKLSSDPEVTFYGNKGDKFSVLINSINKKDIEAVKKLMTDAGNTYTDSQVEDDGYSVIYFDTSESKSITESSLFNARKLIKQAMPHSWGSGKELQPSSNFNNDGSITYASGDFDSHIESLQKALGEDFEVIGEKTKRSIVIKPKASEEKVEEVNRLPLGKEGFIKKFMLGITDLYGKDPNDQAGKRTFKQWAEDIANTLLNVKRPTALKHDLYYYCEQIADALGIGNDEIYDLVKIASKNIEECLGKTFTLPADYVNQDLAGKSGSVTGTWEGTATVAFDDGSTAELPISDVESHMVTESKSNDIKKLKNTILDLISRHKSDSYFMGGEEGNEVWDEMRRLGVADYEDDEHADYLLKCDPIENLEYALELIGKVNEGEDTKIEGLDLSQMPPFKEAIDKIKEVIAKDPKVNESKETDLQKYLDSVGQYLATAKTNPKSYDPDTTSMYRDKIKAIGSELGYSNKELDDMIADSKKKHEK